jgi:hypothetical protein
MIGRRSQAFLVRFDDVRLALHYAEHVSLRRRLLIMMHNVIRENQFRSRQV